MGFLLGKIMEGNGKRPLIRLKKRFQILEDQVEPIIESMHPYWDLIEQYRFWVIGGLAGLLAVIGWILFA